MDLPPPSQVEFLCNFVHTSFSIEANIGEFDEVWRTRATQANKNAKESYNPHPEKVAANLNKHVHSYFHDTWTFTQ
ncbi:hypothetical protein KY290_028892 [Solanum tuberosum]|uniref:Pectate lyase N-terminal domain-containing protein n=1 Tax=Solanum tuberosum TaxID=4113 RepID=A0ABQ7UJ68_SOLTU|nr:hypothetical protein KY284_027875 [Solanum tuberosum]KAH0749660.1 hypothetical protein KY290_028892 [Solanum tuberosum]